MGRGIRFPVETRPFLAPGGPEGVENEGESRIGQQVLPSFPNRLCCLLLFLTFFLSSKTNKQGPNLLFPRESPHPVVSSFSGEVRRCICAWTQMQQGSGAEEAYVRMRISAFRRAMLVRGPSAPLSVSASPVLVSFSGASLSGPRLLSTSPVLLRIRAQTPLPRMLLLTLCCTLPVRHVVRVIFSAYEPWIICRLRLLLSSVSLLSVLDAS